MSHKALMICATHWYPSFQNAWDTHTHGNKTLSPPTYASLDTTHDFAQSPEDLRHALVSVVSECARHTHPQMVTKHFHRRIALHYTEAKLLSTESLQLDLRDSLEWAGRKCAINITCLVALIATILWLREHLSGALTSTGPESFRKTTNETEKHRKHQ